MDERSIILRCLGQNWPNEVSAIGDDLVARIVDDATRGITTNFRSAQGGYNFDLADHINTIIEVASLLASLCQIWIGVKALPRRTEKANKSRDEVLAELLATTLAQAKKVDSRKATELARLIIRVIREMGQE